LKISGVFVLSVATVVLASTVVHPSGPVKAAKSAQPLLAGADIDPVVFQVFERSCRNCDSEKTEWPWYSYIAPVSWLVESDVSQARSHMNLSHWDGYTVEQKQEIVSPTDPLKYVDQSRPVPDAFNLVT
jgi:hypothetical protein